MLDEFIDFVSEIFPCISPDVKYKAKDAVLQFEKEGHQLKFLMMTPLKNFRKEILFQMYHLHVLARMVPKSILLLMLLYYQHRVILIIRNI